MPSLSLPIGSITFNTEARSVSFPSGGSITPEGNPILYASVLNSSGGSFFISNLILSSSGQGFGAVSKVLDSDENEFIIFT